MNLSAVQLYTPGEGFKFAHPRPLIVPLPGDHTLRLREIVSVIVGQASTGPKL